jgi:hypothetical protein
MFGIPAVPLLDSLVEGFVLGLSFQGCVLFLEKLVFVYL